MTPEAEALEVVRKHVRLMTGADTSELDKEELAELMRLGNSMNRKQRRRWAALQRRQR